MSEMEDNPTYPSEESMGENPTEQVTMHSNEEVAKVDTLQQAMDEFALEESYSRGEVPQVYQMDPEASLTLNSDPLVTSDNILGGMIEEVNHLMKDEIAQIQKFQKSIDFWENKIEKNKANIEKNLSQINRNNKEIVYDKKNRDYWFGRSEQVMLDYSNAEAAGREGDWSWLVKKWGLRGADSDPIDTRHPCVEEFCNGSASNLAAEYKGTGNKFENAKKDKEIENNRLIRKNAKFKNTGETLQSYIQSTYSSKIEPIQDGVLLYKELSAKLKSFTTQGSDPTFGDMREWAEVFLSEFIKDNPRVPQHVVTQFRRIASIPLPAEWS